MSVQNIFSFRNIADNDAASKIQSNQALASLPAAQLQFAKNRLVWNSLQDWNTVATTASVALLALGILASVKLLLVLGAAALLARHSIIKTMNGLGTPVAAHHIPHLFQPNHPARVLMLKNFFGLGQNSDFKPDASAFCDMTIFRNPVPVDAPYASTEETRQTNEKILGNILGVNETDHSMTASMMRLISHINSLIELPVGARFSSSASSYSGLNRA